MNKNYLKSIFKIQNARLISRVECTFNLIAKCGLIICIFFSFCFANAETQKERIERLKKTVSTSDNGDVMIYYNNRNQPNVSYDDHSYIKPLFMPLIFHIAPDMDYEKLVKAMEKTEFRGWWTVPPFLGAYLKKELRVNIKYVEESKRFNSRKIMSLIDDGTIIVVCTFKFNSESYPTFKQRNKARFDLETKEDLAENLKKFPIELRKEKLKNGISHPETIIGYNKHTKEFCVKTGPGEVFWYTEEEMSKMTDSVAIMNYRSKNTKNKGKK